MLKLQGPVVIVPTKYYSTPTSKFRDLGISTVIWANHNLRASITAMQSVCQEIKFNESLSNIENKASIYEFKVSFYFSHS